MTSRSDDFKTRVTLSLILEGFGFVLLVWSLLFAFKFAVGLSDNGYWTIWLAVASAVLVISVILRRLGR